MTPEGRVKAAVKVRLKAAGAWYFMPVQNGMGTHGIPDLIACVPHPGGGRFVAIETKAPGRSRDVRPTQRIQLDGITAAGGVAVVIDDPEQLDPIITQLREAP